MLLRFSWSYQLKGPPAYWVASITFILVGSLIAFVLPALDYQDRGTDQAAVRDIALHILGGIFLVLGLPTFVLMMISLWIKRRSPRNLHVWYWWVNFLGGVSGAGMFAIPASLMYPVFYLLYVNRPNVLYPEDKPEVAENNLHVAMIFSGVGVLALIGIYFIARFRFRNRPRWQ